MQRACGPRAWRRPFPLKVQIGAVGRQEQDQAPFASGILTAPRSLLAAEIIENDHAAPFQSRRQLGLDINVEGGRVMGPSSTQGAARPRTASLQCTSAFPTGQKARKPGADRRKRRGRAALSSSRRSRLHQQIQGDEEPSAEGAAAPKSRTSAPVSCQRVLLRRQHFYISETGPAKQARQRSRACRYAAPALQNDSEFRHSDVRAGRTAHSATRCPQFAASRGPARLAGSSDPVLSRRRQSLTAKLGETSNDWPPARDPPELTK